MKIRFETLKLICRKSEELIDLSSQISFFHGELSAGKSTIARLIDFCLGASLETTTAIQQEMVAAQLTLQIGDNHVLIERNKGENLLQVSWSRPNVPPTSVLVVSRGDRAPVVADNIRNLSDLVLYLLGIPVIKVRKRTEDPDSSLVRLSLRDFLTFCYLPQEGLDSEFFLLMTPVRREKSKDVLNYVLGFFSEKLNELQIEYDSVASDQRTKELSAKRIREFLAQFEFGTDADIDQELAAISNKLVELDASLAGEVAQFQSSTHFADDERGQLLAVSRELTEAQEAVFDIARRIDEQRELKAELISMKFKTARADSARNVLAGAKFKVCPNCGQPVSSHRVTSPEDCYLCLQPPKPTDPSVTVDVVRADLDSRISEIDGFLRRQEKARTAVQGKVHALQSEKARRDRELSQLLAAYETDRLARTREAERRRAALLERQAFLERLRKMPQAVEQMAQEADELKVELERIARAIEAEKHRLTDADKNFTLLEEYFLDALVAIGLPGISPDDTVRINRRTLIPEIRPKGDETIAYTFFTAGSGGKKVMITICFALALHRVAAVRHLPLPSFLMIDSPTKNITPDINPALVATFYTYLYSLAASDLSNIQFILVDQTLVTPDEDLEISFQHRLLERGNPRYPPLISYYDGP